MFAHLDIVDTVFSNYNVFHLHLKCTSIKYENRIENKFAWVYQSAIDYKNPKACFHPDGGEIGSMSSDQKLYW